MRDERIVIEVPPSADTTHIEVCIVDVHGDKARVGCEAPRGTSIDHKEVYDAKRRELRAAGRRHA
jgi:sRNA-binding carbon storage regulator CsrA